ncbi:hypothetical protein GS415_04655 [Rhodococcus hoagii]|nr:hypothetical protein [Prescottella equi]
MVRSLIGRLRTALAHAGVRGARTGSDHPRRVPAVHRPARYEDGGRRARGAAFGYPDARVLLLSATPYKP